VPDTPLLRVLVLQPVHSLAMALAWVTSGGLEQV